MEKTIFPRLYDYYNGRLLNGTVCGTITASGNRISTACGTYWVIEHESDTNTQKDGIRQEDKESLESHQLQEHRANMTELAPRADGLC